MTPEQREEIVQLENRVEALRKALAEIKDTPETTTIEDARYMARKAWEGELQ